jgi:UDP-glucose 6-dehydrogenase
VSRVAVIGTGYVGLTTGAYLAHIGHEVTCADVVEEKVARLMRGEVPIHEPGLAEMVGAGLATGKLRFVVGSARAVDGAEFVFLCLPTPQGHDGAADMSYIREEAERIGPLVAPGSVVVNKSTVPVGSTRMVQRALNRGDVLVVSNPEFLREGSAVHDSLNPDRIVIGADDPAAASRVAVLYDQIKAPVLVTDPASSELIKYASNAFLATKVSYINAVANLCEVVGADVREVVLGMGYDKRIGFEFLRPGPGWGGSCFHPDETLLVRHGEDVRLLSFAELFSEVERAGTEGWEAMSWDPCGVSAEFLPISAFSRRPYAGDLVEVRTKMGRRLRTTADHPFVVGDGSGLATGRKLAGDLTTTDWLPIAQGAPEPPARVPGTWSVSRRGAGLALVSTTNDRPAADAMLRSLGDLGVCARVEGGQCSWRVTVAGAAQVEAALWLLPEDEQRTVQAAIDGQTKRIAPTGYRRSKNAAWVRVVDVTRRPYHGHVYSVEVPATHTVVTTGGLVASNCLPKDTRALVRIADDAGYGFGLLEGVIEVNDEQYERMVLKVSGALGGELAGRTLAVWGLTFKAMTDDLRDSPALEVVGRLLRRGATVRAYDPMVSRERGASDARLDGVDLGDDPYAICTGADAVVVLTEWDEFRWLDFDKVRDALVRPVLVDCRNLLDPVAMRKRGFTYTGVGRP